MFRYKLGKVYKKDKRLYVSDCTGSEKEGNYRYYLCDPKFGKCIESDTKPAGDIKYCEKFEKTKGAFENMLPESKAERINQNLKIVIIGAGPVGLMVSYLFLERSKNCTINIIEKNKEYTRKQIVALTDTSLSLLPKEVLDELFYKEGHAGCFVYWPGNARYSKCFADFSPADGDDHKWASISISVFEKVMLNYLKKDNRFQIHYLKDRDADILEIKDHKIHFSNDINDLEFDILVGCEGTRLTESTEPEMEDEDEEGFGSPDFTNFPDFPGFPKNPEDWGDPDEFGGGLGNFIDTSFVRGKIIKSPVEKIHKIHKIQDNIVYGGIILLNRPKEYQKNTQTHPDAIIDDSDILITNITEQFKQLNIGVNPTDQIRPSTYNLALGFNHFMRPFRTNNKDQPYYLGILLNKLFYDDVFTKEINRQSKEKKSKDMNFKIFIDNYKTYYPDNESKINEFIKFLTNCLKFTNMFGEGFTLENSTMSIVKILLFRSELFSKVVDDKFICICGDSCFNVNFFTGAGLNSGFIQADILTNLLTKKKNNWIEDMKNTDFRSLDVPGIYEMSEFKQMYNEMDDSYSSISKMYDILIKNLSNKIQSSSIILENDTFQYNPVKTRQNKIINHFSTSP